MVVTEKQAAVLLAFKKGTFTIISFTHLLVEDHLGVQIYVRLKKCKEKQMSVTCL